MCSPFSAASRSCLLLGAEVRNAAGVRVVRGGECFLDHLVGLVDAALDGGVDDGLAGEALLAADIHVHREDHGVGGGDDGGVQRLGAGGALGFDLQVHAHFLGGGNERVGGHVGVGDAGGAGGDGDEALGPAWPCRSVPGSAPAAAAAATAGAAAVAAAAAWAAGLSARAPSTSSTISSREDAARRLAVKSFLIRDRASLDSSFRCSWSAPSGAAMKKIRSAGPSLAPKSTLGWKPGHGQGRFGDRRRAAVRDGDAAGDAGGGLLFAGEGVGKEAFDLGGASGGSYSAGQMPDHVLGRAAQVLVELDQFGGDELSHCQSFRRAVMVTASGVVWWTAGTVEPGREAAAAPCATA